MTRTDDVSLDKLDLRILRHLSEDGRRSFQTIARDLGVSYGTVRSRYLKMRERNGLRIVGWVDPAQVGLQAFASIRISIEAPFVEEAALQIAQLPEVNWLGRVIGEFDLNGDVSCPDTGHLARLIDERINKIRGVRETRVALYTKTYKHTTIPKPSLLEEILGEGGS